MPNVPKWQSQAFNPDLSDRKGLHFFPYTSLFLSVMRTWLSLERDPRPGNLRAIKTGTFSQQPRQAVVCRGLQWVPYRWCGGSCSLVSRPQFRWVPEELWNRGRKGKRAWARYYPPGLPKAASGHS